MSALSSPAYRVVEGWEQLPEGMTHKDVADVAVDSADRVYVLARMQARVLVYDRDGTFLRSWGEGALTERPHGITIGTDDTVYLVDEGDNTVRVYSTEGELRSTIGVPGTASDTGVDPRIGDLYDRIGSIRRGAGPFNKPTKAAIAPNGDIYVTDGYGNARVHHFDVQGRLLNSWGEPGNGIGQFHLPHCAAVAPDGTVLVADRENDRIQLFNPDGRYVGEWTDFHRVAAVHIRDSLVYVAELSWRSGYRSWRHGRIDHFEPSRVSVLDLDGHFLARLGGEPGHAPNNFAAAHGISTDSHGDIYVAEVTFSDQVRLGLVPEDCHTLLKLSRVQSA